MRGWVAPLMCLAGCNLVFGLEPPGGSGGDASGDGSSDPGDGPPPADAPSTWTGAHAVVASGLDVENDPILTADGTTAIYALATNGYPFDLVTAAVSPSGWGAATVVAELSSTEVDSTPRFGAGDLVIFFASSRPGGQGLLDIWTSSRDTLLAPWKQPVLLTQLSSAASDRTPSPCENDNRFVFVSERDGMIQLYEQKLGEGAVPITLPLSEPRTPFVTEDCRTLYFSAGVDPISDLYVTTRTSIGAAWSTPAPIAELNTSAHESDPWVSADGRHILFSRNGDIWEAFR